MATTKEKQEIAKLVNEFAQAVKVYGLGLGKDLPASELSHRIDRANAAQAALWAIGIEVSW